jgi:hypothetical protein
MKRNPTLYEVIRSLVEAYFPLLRRTVRKNLAGLTTAFVDLALSVRFD